MIQESRFAGLFYPNTRHELESSITTFFNSLTYKKEEDTTGIIMPHAGYRYSGSVAAESIYDTQTKRYKTAVIVGPSHHYQFFGASILDKKAYETPLGNMHIDEKKVKVILKNKTNEHIIYEPKAYKNEHSIEVILPFLQILHPSITIIPIVIGQYNNKLIEDIAHSINQNCNAEETLVITSTDFSHFLSAEQAKKKDLKAVSLIKEKNIEKLKIEQEKKTIQLCGLGPLLIMMTILNQWEIQTAEHLTYYHSGMVTGDFSSVVGYNSFRFY